MRDERYDDGSVGLKCSKTLRCVASDEREERSALYWPCHRNVSPSTTCTPARSTRRLASDSSIVCGKSFPTTPTMRTSV